MARDYRNAEVFSPGTRPLPLWMWFFAAIAISGFVGLIYYLDQYEKNKSGAVDSSSQDDVSVTTPSDSQNKNKENAKDSKTSFDFYKLLPKISVDVPKSNTQQRGSDAAETPSSQPGFNYILQVGSFKDYKEADRLKARLAFLGIEVHIEKVTLNSSEVWHRVRVGPLQSEREMNKIRGQLRKQQIEPIMLKVKA